MVSCGIVQSDRLVEPQFTRLPGLMELPVFMSLLTPRGPLAPFGKLARSVSLEAPFLLPASNAAEP